MSRVRLPGVILVGLLGLAILGCRDPNMPDLGRVAGRVTLDGEPVANARLIFTPLGKQPCVGKTDEDGNYEMMFDIGVPGAVVGMNKVAISTMWEEHNEQGERIMIPETIPEKYNAMSTLEFEVTGSRQTKNWDLMSD